jgi:hypothetical protein
MQIYAIFLSFSPKMEASIFQTGSYSCEVPKQLATSVQDSGLVVNYDTNELNEHWSR